MIVISLTPERAEFLGVIESDGEVSEYVTPSVLNIIASRIGRRGVGERYVSIIVGNLSDEPQPALVIQLDGGAEVGRLLLGSEIVSRPDPMYDVTYPITRSPISYAVTELDQNTCLCGCGESTGSRTFRPGHDQRAIHDRIARYFGGSTATALAELDRVFGPGGVEARFANEGIR